MFDSVSCRATGEGASPHQAGISASGADPGLRFAPSGLRIEITNTSHHHNSLDRAPLAAPSSRQRGSFFMILIGQYDSPFVRRVGIALTLYGIPFEHKPWSTFGEADKIRPYNPLTRVPTLVLDDGDVLVDSAAIID